MSIIVGRGTEREWWAQLPVHRYANTGRLFLVTTAACASDERGLLLQSVVCTAVEFVMPTLRCYNTLGPTRYLGTVLRTVVFARLLCRLIFSLLPLYSVLTAGQ